MEWIARQPYIKTQRGVDGTDLVEIEEVRELYLYADKIVSKYREFPLHRVWDLSYREIGEEGGLLYIHTTGGVYTYLVKVSAVPFIEVFKEIKQNEVKG